jgi:dipeptidyl-peptidase-4
MASTPVDTFPRQHARTRRFTSGEPRDVTVSPDGRRVVFLRSRDGSDPVNCLWVADADTGEERLVADPAALLTEDRDLPAEELAQRERTRESASGITSYATDRAGTVAAFALGGQLYVAGLLSARARLLDVAGPVFDPRPDPLARRVAYVSGRLLCIAELDGSWRVLAGGELDEPETVSWGSADFIAAEEMHRFRGYWWSPDGATLAVCRVDTTPVQHWYVADASQPASEPREILYPAAGTPNAEVSLHLFAAEGGEPVDVEWDRAAFEYLADVHWSKAGLLITVQSRDQRRLEVRRVDVSTGATEPVFADRDDAWVDLVPGSPALLPDGRLVVTADRDGARRLLVSGVAVTPAHLQVRSVAASDEAGVVFLANAVDDATSLHVWRWSPNGGLHAVTDEPGVHTAVATGEALVVRSTTLDETGARWVLPGGGRLTSYAETPLVRPSVQLLTTRDRAIATAVLLPSDHDGARLPVLLDPYAGPHAQRVVRSSNAHLTSQWFADQGFAVVIVDGRGTPGRGTTFERAVRGDLATVVLDDQIEGLHHAADELDVLDLDRVAIRGWSFGGYLAALAVLRRPDVFHAAIAGAPVTDWQLYDTHYTERYLGDPATSADAYEASSLLPLADRLARPLLLIHGLADDNVVAAHTLQLSSALLAAGKPHEVLPLVGVTHMTPQEVVAEHLLLHQLDFLRRALPETGAVPAGGYGASTEEAP